MITMLGISLFTILEIQKHIIYLSVHWVHVHNELKTRLSATARPKSSIFIHVARINTNGRLIDVISNIWYILWYVPIRKAKALIKPLLPEIDCYHLHMNVVFVHMKIRSVNYFVSMCFPLVCVSGYNVISFLNGYS